MIRLKESVKRHLPFLILMFLLAFNLFYNLDNQILWQDEAETALVGQTILERGIPYGKSGPHSYSQLQGKELGANGEWKLHPWLQFYFTAGSFAVFGVSTYTARLPFALCSLLSLLLLYLLSHKLWNNRNAATISVFMLAFSVAYLLLSRQARYYAPAMAFSLWLVLGYASWMKGEKRWWLHLSFATLFLIHTHYISAAALVAALSIHALIFQRRQAWKPVLCMAGVALFNVPFFIWFFDNPYFNEVSNIISITNVLSLLKEYTVEFINGIFSLWPFIAVTGLLMLIHRNQKNHENKSWQHVLQKLFISKEAALYWILIIVYISIFSLLSNAFYFRYLAPLLPITLLYLGWIFSLSEKMHLLIPYSFAAWLIFSAPLDKFFREITTKQLTGPVTAIITYFENQALPGDKVAITYGDLPLKFYTDLRIIGALSGEDINEGLNADFVILRNTSIMHADATAKQFWYENLDLDQFDIIQLSVSDTPFENREVVEDHYFNNDRQGKPVFILKRKPGNKK
ncbi:MAG: glycosyltransferase family 39 protein [Bacteroidia bacterium]